MLRPILVSACLLGLRTRYDGQTKTDPRVLEFLAQHRLLPIPVCPEQLAGLPIPRPATQFAAGSGAEVLSGSGRLINVEGRDLTSTFLHGARETLKVAHLTGADQALFKERSPSCGVHAVHCNDRIVPGSGVACALLRQQGLRVFSEAEL